MDLVPATFVMIDKGQSGFPLYIKNILVDAKMLWDYCHGNHPGILCAVKDILGIPENSPVFSGVWASYLIDPDTGKVCTNCVGTTLEEFLQSVFVRQNELLSGAGFSALISIS